MATSIRYILEGLSEGIFEDEFILKSIEINKKINEENTDDKEVDKFWKKVNNLIYQNKDPEYIVKELKSDYYTLVTYY